MKKALILFIVVVLAVPSFSQEKSDVASEKNVLKINTLVFSLQPVRYSMSVNCRRICFLAAITEAVK
jgi:hypothetical protein